MPMVARSMGGSSGDILEPRKGKIVDTAADTTGESERYAICDAMGELHVLTDDIEEGI